jgi:hypothetical protein
MTPPPTTQHETKHLLRHLIINVPTTFIRTDTPVAIPSLQRPTRHLPPGSEAWPCRRRWPARRGVRRVVEGVEVNRR